MLSFLRHVEDVQESQDSKELRRRSVMIVESPRNSSEDLLASASLARSQPADSPPGEVDTTKQKRRSLPQNKSSQDLAILLEPEPKPARAHRPSLPALPTEREQSPRMFPRRILCICRISGLEAHDFGRESGGGSAGSASASAEASRAVAVAVAASQRQRQSQGRQVARPRRPCPQARRHHHQGVQQNGNGKRKDRRA